MRTDAVKTGDVQRMQAWAGQSAALGQTEPAAALIERVWTGAGDLLH
jgi:nitronate monooxygenase